MNTRLLYPPANHERLRPEELPIDDRHKFLLWSSYACVEWPVELMAAAFHAQTALDGCYAVDPANVPKFVKAYKEWHALAEDEKLKAMHQVQRESDRRDMFRRDASNVVRNGWRPTRHVAGFSGYT